MNFLTQPTSTYLLGKSLGSLHEESRSWLDEIDFWQNEMVFLYKLLNKRLPTKNFPSEKLSLLEKKLIDIQTAKLDKIKSDLLKHQLSLSALLKNPPWSDEEDFREQHHKLLAELYAFQDLIKSFKREVFLLF
jgi:hypothetical protein